MKKYVIWNSDAVDEEFVKDERAEMESVYPDQTDDWWWRYAKESNREFLNCTQEALSGIEFPKEIIIFAELGLWNGKRPAWFRTETNEVSKVLTPCITIGGDTNIEYWVDAYGNLRAEESHHDGTNTYLFRVFKDSVSEKTEQFILDKAACGTLTKDDITRYTRRVGKKIADVYGWKVRG